MEILLALCRCEIGSLSQVEGLLDNCLSVYFVGSPKQRFTEYVIEKYRQQGLKHPAEIETFELTRFLIRANKRFPQLFKKTCQYIDRYLAAVCDQMSINGLLSIAGLIDAFIYEDGSMLTHVVVDRLSTLITQPFLSAVENLVSQSVNNNALIDYFDNGREICSLLFCKLVQKLQVKYACSILNVPIDSSLVKFLLDLKSSQFNEDKLKVYSEFKLKVERNRAALTKLCTYSLVQLTELEEGAQYIDLSTHNRISLAYDAKSYMLQVLALGLLLDYKVSEFIELVHDAVLDATTDSVITNKNQVRTVVAVASLLNFYTEEVSSELLRVFPILISSKLISKQIVSEISAYFSIGLKPLTEDAIVSAIYSINNLLALAQDGLPIPVFKERRVTVSGGANNHIDRLLSPRSHRASTVGTFQSLQMFRNSDTDLSSIQSPSGSSSLSPQPSHSVEKTAIYHDKLFENVVVATTTIASNYNDQSITALSVTILTQKFRVVSPKLDKKILEGLANLAVCASESEFSLLMKFFNTATNSAIEGKDVESIKNIVKAKTVLSRELVKKQPRSPLYKLYMHYLLDAIVSRGDVDRLEHHRSHSEIAQVADQIAIYLKPLAALLPEPGQEPLNISLDDVTTNMFRNVWFNAVVHGFHLNSNLTIKYYTELKTIAYNSPPLASDFPSNNRETSLEMNTILRRGSSNHNLKQQKQIMAEQFSLNIMSARTLSTSKIMFLSATFFLESLRCEAGDCSKTLLYFSDPSITTSNIDKLINSIAISMIGKFTKLIVKGDPKIFSAENVASQLTNLLLLLTHRDSYLQDAAYQCCDVFISKIPSSLCHRSSLYTLLDSLTMLFDSIVCCETNKYEAKFEFLLKHSRRRVLLPDSYQWRTSTLERLHQSAKKWTRSILKIANQDAKILLQSYISDLGDFQRLNSVEFGVSFALEMAGTILSVDRELSNINRHGYGRPDSVSGFLSQHAWRSRFLIEKNVVSSYSGIEKERSEVKAKIDDSLSQKESVDQKDLSNFLDLSATLLIVKKGESASLVYDIVHTPFQIFTSSAMKIATNVWLSVVKERTDLSHILISEVGQCWMRSIDDRRGLYSKEHDLAPEEFQPMEYAPYDKKEIDQSAHSASKSIQPHLHVIRFFTSHFEGTMFDSRHLLQLFTTLCLYGMSHLDYASLHPFARLSRTELLNFGILVLNTNLKYNTQGVSHICTSLVKGALSWFKRPLSWPFGANELKIRADLALLIEFYKSLTTQNSKLSIYCGDDLSLLEYFLVSEIRHLEVWLNPLAKSAESAKLPMDLIDRAFANDAELAVSLVERYSTPKNEERLRALIRESPLACVHSREALRHLLSGSKDLHYVLYWRSVSPLESINLFLPEWATNTFVAQYNVRALESHDVNLTFFYVPQIVQCLRCDPMGYVERFIVDTAKISVLFAHQIIWNMLANSFKDDEGEVPDELKPTLDRIRQKMVKKFTNEQRDFYEREFKFFNEVTGISGKLKPYIKKTKAEKKQKIDEEMQKIAVEKDVYLPSNPDGVVVDIDRQSGKPLQSHAKAPFMATFKIKKTVRNHDTGKSEYIEKWQGAIFKVGDDCRQDVLALQLISVFRSIWSCIGLDVYVFPYRVTATAPGCGVIDVLPNSISRDMLGREAVNGLYEYFITKFGHENTIEFQHARNNFVKSLAGYSVISYLLQFKDRHNGNIMYDDQGHCLHIDFGFIFDIVPGGVKFEAVPFKLTKEMVRVMGGSPDTQAYREFEELCIKAYLAARPHMNAILECVKPMLGSGLPCFKGIKTIKNLESRFVPHKSDHDAAEHMLSLIKKSYESIFTKGYDEFQRLTNGIPY